MCLKNSQLPSSLLMLQQRCFKTKRTRGCDGILMMGVEAFYQAESSDLTNHALGMMIHTAPASILFCRLQWCCYQWWAELRPCKLRHQDPWSLYMHCGAAALFLQLLLRLPKLPCRPSSPLPSSSSSSLCKWVERKKAEVDLEVERKKVQMGVEVEGSQQILLWIFASIGPGTAVGPTPRIKRANQISTVHLMKDQYTLHTAQEDEQIILPFSCRHGLHSWRMFHYQNAVQDFFAVSEDWRGFRVSSWVLKVSIATHVVGLPAIIFTVVAWIVLWIPEECFTNRTWTKTSLLFLQLKRV